MQIADLLIPHLTDLPEASQLALILGVRERRRFVAKLTRAVRATPRRSKKDPLANMTKEQLEQLLKELTG